MPAKLTSAILEALRKNDMVAQRWHPEGRTGTRVGVYGDRRSVPVLPELVVDLAQRPEAVDESLRTLLRSPGVQLQLMGVTKARPLREDAAEDMSVHPELRAATVCLPAAPPGSFTFCELFEGGAASSLASLPVSPRFLTFLNFLTRLSKPDFRESSLAPTCSLSFRRRAASSRSRSAEALERSAAKRLQFNICSSVSCSSSCLVSFLSEGSGRLSQLSCGDSDLASGSTSLSSA